MCQKRACGQPMLFKLIKTEKFGGYYSQSQEQKDHQAKIKQKYNFAGLKIGEAITHKFSEYEKTATRKYKNGRYKREHEHISCIIKNCANHYAKKHKLKWQFIQRKLYDETGDVAAVDIIRVK